MTLRSLTRVDSYFLVKYTCDDTLQVRSRGHFKQIQLDDQVFNLFFFNELTFTIQHNFGTYCHVVNITRSFTKLNTSSIISPELDRIIKSI